MYNVITQTFKLKGVYSYGKNDATVVAKKRITIKLLIPRVYSKVGNEGQPKLYCAPSQEGQI